MFRKALIPACLSLVFVLGGAVPPASAAGNGVVYDCTMTGANRKNGWIPPQVAIAVRSDGQVFVSDAVVLAFVGQPVPAKVQRNDAAKLKLSWVVDNVRDAGNKPAVFDYSATLTKAGNTVKVFADPKGYPNRFAGNGTCTVLER